MPDFALAGGLVSGCAPDSAVTFFCFAKRKLPKFTKWEFAHFAHRSYANAKRRAGFVVPSLRYRHAALLSLGGVARELAALKHARPLIRARQREAALSSARLLFAYFLLARREKVGRLPGRIPASLNANRLQNRALNPLRSRAQNPDNKVTPPPAPPPTQSQTAHTHWSVSPWPRSSPRLR